MNIDTGTEGIDHRLLAGDMRHKPQLDLRIVGRDKLLARRGDKGGADLPALCRADRNVLHIRVGRGQPPGRGADHRERGMDPTAVGKNAVDQRIGIG